MSAPILPATITEWDKIDHFEPSEFQGKLHLLDHRVPYVIDKLRKRIGGRLVPSPVGGAIAREGKKHKSSQHYANPQQGIYSTAIDLMSPDIDLFTVFREAQEMSEIGGIGLYPDWNPFPGVHIDLRLRKPGGAPAIWMAKKVIDDKGGSKQVYVGIDWDYINQRAIV